MGKTIFFSSVQKNQGEKKKCRSGHMQKDQNKMSNLNLNISVIIASNVSRLVISLKDKACQTGLLRIQRYAVYKRQGKL